MEYGWLGWEDLNPRHSVPETDVLPLNYTPKRRLSFHILMREILRLRVAIRTQQTEVLNPVIIPHPILVMELKYQGFTVPHGAYPTPTTQFFQQPTFYQSWLHSVVPKLGVRGEHLLRRDLVPRMTFEVRGVKAFLFNPGL